MFAVTLLGTAVAVVSSRLITAVLAVLGGLLTPVLLQVDRADERNLLAYLLVLDALVLLTARFRTWPQLNRLAWLGTALLLLPVLVREPEAPRPLTRLLLLSALFLIFLAVPLFRDRAVPAETGRRGDQIDLALVVANAAAYFWAVYVTLEAWRPSWEGPYALVLAVLYRLVAADYASRVPDDRVTVDVHEGVSWTLLTLAIPLALDGQWVTLAWAVQGVMLLWLASRAPAPMAAWGGLAALLLAAVRAVALDHYWSTDTTPVWNLAFLVHLLVVVALAVGGGLGGRALGVPLAGLTSAARGARSGWPPWSRWPLQLWAKTSGLAGRPADRRSRRGCGPGSSSPPSSSPPAAGRRGARSRARGRRRHGPARRRVPGEPRVPLPGGGLRGHRPGRWGPGSIHGDAPGSHDRPAALGGRRPGPPLRPQRELDAIPGEPGDGGPRGRAEPSRRGAAVADADRALGALDALRGRFPGLGLRPIEPGGPVRSARALWSNRHKGVCH